jgi:Subtilisin-like serine proteases
VYALSRRRPAVVVSILATLTLVLATLTSLAVVGGPALARSGPESPRVKYYLVTEEHASRPDALVDIARRLLGGEDRASEIVALNAGRTQPDGGTFTDGSSLRVGWALILPWDAVGDGVRYGVLPEPSPVAPTTPETPSAGGGGSSTTTPSGGPTSPEPATPSTAPPATAPAETCAETLGPPADETSWAHQRLSPREAWSTGGRGSGVIVAVVDSGVDARVPQLLGRVSGGVDIVAGTEAGAVDCLGSGTAMAALIVGDDSHHTIGLAPDATVLPVRLVTDQPEAPVADQVTAIQVAISAGARVIAVGSYVDVSQPEVRKAIDDAARHDVVVVVPGPVPDDGSLPAQLVRVGMLNRDGQLAQEYPPGTIDVVAPGQDVTSLGPGDQGGVQVSGPQYAVAFVAGTAALVRGASPTLTAEQVARQLRTTATPIDPASDDPADPATPQVAALVNPAQAVVLASAPSPAPRLNPVRPAMEHQDAGRGTLLVGAVVLVLLALAGVLMLRRRRPLPASEWDTPDQPTADDMSRQT